VQFFFPDGSNVKTGWLLPLHQKTYPTSYFEMTALELPKGEDFELYFRLRNKSEVPLLFGWELSEWNSWESNFIRKKMQDNLLHFFLQGMFWIILIYNLFLFFVSHEKIYLYYAGYILGASLFVMQNVGIINEFIISSHPEMSYYFRMAGVFAGGISYVLFAQNFLESRIYYPRWHRIMNFFMLGFLILGIILFILVAVFYKIYFYIVSASSYAGIVYLGLIIFSFYLIFRKNANRISFYFSLGMFLFSGSALLGIFFRFLNPNTNLAFFIEAGLVAEILVFSLGLGYRMKLIEMQKIEAEAENARILKEQNDLLEKKVNERTFEIQMQKEEIMVQNEELQQQKEEILTQRDYIEKQNNELAARSKMTEDSIRAAVALQKGVLPSPERLKTLLGDYFLLYLPKDIVSGDFYWGTNINGKIYLAIADCTGHGVPGALATMIGYAKIDKIARQNSDKSPAEILNLLDLEVSEITKEEQVNSSFGMDFALLTLEKENENEEYKAVFAGAKRSLFYFDAQKEIIQELKGTRKSVGVGKNEKEFQNIDFKVKSGDTVYLFTDGYADQNNGAREKFGMLSFKKILDVLVHMPLDEQREYLHETLKNFSKGTEQRDDILVLGFRLE
jgi:serine phosphatase RsbU (regulator of sigma subunit)